MMTMHIVRCLILICLFVLRVHGKTDSGTGALTIVQQDIDDNGVTLENENGDSEIVDEKYEPFHPTHEWQTVKQGQAIPAGLHVRMNFETGEKEARLMDGATKDKEKRLSDEEAEYKYWRDGERQGMMNMDRKQFSMNELKKALKDFKTTQLEDTDLQREAEVKKKFKSYEELRQDFIDMNMDIKTDGEIIEGLLSKMKHADIPRDDLLTVLKDLEYYLHQIDNGVLFKDLGGIPYILNIVNNSGDEVLQIEAALVLGAAMSSNPKVQIGALEAGALPLLLRVISVNSSLPVQRRLIYCLSTLCRNFPYAQKQFLESGGLAALSNVFDVFESGMEMKVKVKIVSLLNDLLMEKTLTLDNANEDITTDSEKLKQYKQVYLLEALVEQGWCERITKLLKWLHINTISDHDETEHVLNTMLTLSTSTSSTSCRPVFIHSLTDLQNVQSGYRTLSQQHDDDADDYFMNIVNVISDIIRNISLKDEL